VQGTILGNDQILCGEVKSTDYIVSRLRMHQGAAARKEVGAMQRLY
jgi:hypothetical protein